MIKKYIDDGTFPHLILLGPKGTGKTSLATVLINEFDCLELSMNSSDDNGVDIIRERVMNFVRVQSNKLKVVFMDEADKLTPDAQDCLRNITETYCGDTRFILTGNYDKFTEPFSDRFQIIRFSYVSKKDIKEKIIYILNKEDVVCQDTILNLVIEKIYPSFRRILNTLQQNIVIENDKKVINEIISFSGQDYEKIISTAYEYFKANDLEKMREYLIDNSFYEFNLLYRHWFKNIKNPLYKVLISEYLYRDGYSSDKELNFVGMCYALHSGAYPFTLKT